MATASKKRGKATTKRDDSDESNVTDFDSEDSNSEYGKPLAKRTKTNDNGKAKISSKRANTESAHDTDDDEERCEKEDKSVKKEADNEHPEFVAAGAPFLALENNVQTQGHVSPGDRPSMVVKLNVPANGRAVIKKRHSPAYESDETSSDDDYDDEDVSDSGNAAHAIAMQNSQARGPRAAYTNSYPLPRPSSGNIRRRPSPQDPYGAPLDGQPLSHREQSAYRELSTHNAYRERSIYRQPFTSHESSNLSGGIFDDHTSDTFAQPNYNDSILGSGTYPIDQMSYDQGTNSANPAEYYSSNTGYGMDVANPAEYHSSNNGYGVNEPSAFAQYDGFPSHNYDGGFDIMDTHQYPGRGFLQQPSSYQLPTPASYRLPVLSTDLDQYMSAPWDPSTASWNTPNYSSIATSYPVPAFTNTSALTMGPSPEPFTGPSTVEATPSVNESELANGNLPADDPVINPIDLYEECIRGDALGFNPSNYLP